MNKIKRLIYVAIGLIAFVLGAIGVILPVLPTTPFLLLTSFCFIRGSEKIDTWFKGTKIYKKHLESFIKEKAMTMKQKMTILIFAILFMMIPLIIVKSIHVKIFIALVILVKVYYFIFKIKTMN